MDWMSYWASWAYNSGSDPYTYSNHWEFPPAPIIAQLSIADYYEFDDQATIELGFTHVEYLAQGAPRHEDWPDIDSWDSPRALGRNSLTRIDWDMRISNCAGFFLINTFAWGSVS
jgi:hypothetical protein